MSKSVGVSPVVSHRSSYVRFDILQRVLSRMFGVTVVHAMVITDIDDKIIRRGWEVRRVIDQVWCGYYLCSYS